MVFLDLTTILNTHMASSRISVMLKKNLSELSIFESLNNYTKGKIELPFYVFYGK